MKKFTFFLLVIFSLFLSQKGDAQVKTGADYFAGKWNILVLGTPNCDRKMVFVLEKKETGIIGVVQDTTGKELSKVAKAELNTNTITLYYSMNEHDVVTELTKKDKD